MLETVDKMNNLWELKGEVMKKEISIGEQNMLEFWDEGLYTK